MFEEKLNGVFYRTNRKKNSKTIFFVHGFVGSSSGWNKYLNFFKKNYNVIAMDLRGHGRSDKNFKKNDYSIDNFTSDVLNIMKKESVNSAIFIGHSFGNYILFNLLNKYHKKVLGIVFVSIDPNPSKKIITKIVYPLSKSFLFILNKKQSKKIGYHIDYSKFINTGDWNIRRISADLKNTGFKQFLNVYNLIYKINLTQKINHTNIPFLIINGKKDTLISKNSGEEFRKLISNSKLKIFENSNHILLLNDYEELVNELNCFVKDICK